MDQAYLEAVLDRREFPELLDVDTSHIQGKKVLITGASGSLGKALMQRLQALPLECIPTNRLGDQNCEQMDITNNKQVAQIISKHKPHIIVHLAAKTSAPWCEDFPEQAMVSNALSTSYITDAMSSDMCLIFASSSMASEGFNVYGATKLLSENIIRRVRSRAIRFYNIIPTRGFLLDKWVQASEGATIIVPEGVHRIFISKREAVEALLYLIHDSVGNGIFSIVGPKEQLLEDVARRLYPPERLKLKSPLAGGKDYEYPEYSGEALCQGRIIRVEN